MKIILIIFAITTVLFFGFLAICMLTDKETKKQIENIKSKEIINRFSNDETQMCSLSDMIAYHKKHDIIEYEI